MKKIAVFIRSKLADFKVPTEGFFKARKEVPFHFTEGDSPDTVKFAVESGRWRWFLRRITRLRLLVCAATSLVLVVVLYAPLVAVLLCETWFFDAVGTRSSVSGPTVYVVTTTYRRTNQAPALVRLSQTLMLARVRIFWIVVEDDKRSSSWIACVQNVGVFPVGLTGTYRVSSPVVSSGGKVEGFLERHNPNRTFPMDMAGFAINVRLILSSTRPRMGVDILRVATVFLESLGVSLEDLEPLASNCTERSSLIMYSKAMFVICITALVLAARPISAAPVAEINEAASKIPVSALRSPTDVNIRIPEAFNMKLLAGRGGTDLNIDIPAILNLRLDRSRGRSGGMLLDLFGASNKAQST
ncbi:hypothetical protein HPB50_026908 [Hyalomma asiaticum]|uniref:Uncharacterized protein n=1 Tax=Hyalomma asiaticum TaxID=266040 RepID=A0ACB7S8A2_HYAAI|nr:hypothetical protein HPB50_026908 [Hyalomma asiaticum]